MQISSLGSPVIELEMTLRPSDSLEFGFAGSVVNAEFDSTVRDGTGAVLGGIREGNRLPSVPKVQLSASVTYNFTLARRESYVTASYQHVGSRFTQPGDQEPGAGVFTHNLDPFGGMTGAEVTSVNLELDAYTFVNLNMGIESDTWTLMAYVNNVYRHQGIRATVIMPAEVDTPILDGRPLPPGSEARATMMQPEDVAQAVRLAVTLPPRTVIEHMVISPTHLRDVSRDLTVAREFGRPGDGT